METHFTKEKILVANKHIKRYPISLVMKELATEITSCQAEHNGKN